MCHISHHRYREDAWSRGGWTWIEEADEPERRDPDLRVSQAERDEVVAALAGHFADGRLTVEEYEERVEVALAARTGRDFEPLLADLPAADPLPTPARTTRRRVPDPAGGRLIPTRLVAVTAVVVLAIATGPWALWLLWPALLFTGGCGSGRRYGRARPDFRTHAPEPPVVQRL
ncbi:MAG: DUF1707 SHOCT-like domain-containing protein [Acidimicrobiales bacterium]